MKSLCILGSTGSIGTQTLDVVRQFPDEFNVEALASCSNLELIEKQVREFKPSVICLFDEEKMDTWARGKAQELIAGAQETVESGFRRSALSYLARFGGFL